MENQSNFSKFVSRQTVRMMENKKRMRIILIIGAVLGIISMYFALSAVHERVNPKPARPSPAETSAKEKSIVYGDFTCSLAENYLVIESYGGSESVVNIPAAVDGYPVRAIGDNAFTGNRSISSVTFPATVMSLGAHSFAGCSSLVNVELSEGIESIGSNTFANCGMLRAVILPRSFRAAYPGSFRGCAEGFLLYVHEGSSGESFARSNGYSYELVSDELMG